MNKQKSDLPQFLRGSIGFDQIGDLISQALGGENPMGSYPPYNIEKTDENQYRVTLAIAGFTEDEISIEQEATVLKIEGSKAAKGEDGKTYIHRGISGRAFNRQFQLADHVKVTNARLSNGLLEIDLERKVPKSSQPRSIKIKSA